MQNKILEVDKAWEKDWQGMPEYSHDDVTSFSAVIIHFRNKDDRNEFAKRIGQKLTHKTKSIWFPAQEIFQAVNYEYRDKESKRRKK